MSQALLWMLSILQWDLYLHPSTVVKLEWQGFENLPHKEFQFPLKSLKIFNLHSLWHICDPHYLAVQEIKQH